MINPADFENMPLPYKLAGEKLCKYIQLADKSRRKQSQCEIISSDCELLRLYSSGEGADCDFDRILKLSDVYATDVDNDGMMSFGEAEAIRNDLADKCEVIEGELEILERAVRVSRLDVKQAIHDALRLSRKTNRISYKSDSSYLEFRSKLNTCLTQKKNEQIAIRELARSMSPDMIDNIKKLFNPE